MILQLPRRALDLSSPKVMGILNVTPDSFSDGGLYQSVDNALRQADAMVGEGATIIDIGAESSRPGAAVVSEAEELDRICPVIEAASKNLQTIISIDTSTAAVMREGVRLGAEIINDVRSLTRPGSLQAAADSGVPVCIMHMQGTPQNMQENPSYADVVSEVSDFFDRQINRLELAGIERNNLLIDPGFGFGKRLAHNLSLLGALERFTEFDLPLLVGISRKSMLGDLTGRATEQRLAGSLAAAALAVHKGAHIIRAHDVAATVDAVKVSVAVRGVNSE